MSLAPLPPTPARPGRRSVLATAHDAVPFERSMRVMLAMGGPMVLAVMSGRPELGALASIGTVIAPTIGAWTYRQRARRIPLAAVLLGAAYALGATANGNVAASVVAVGVLAAVTSLAAGVVGEWAAPMAATSAVACIIGTGLEPGGRSALLSGAIVAAGGLWVALVFALGWLSNRWQPQTRAVAAVFTAIADYLVELGAPEADARRIAARRTLMTAWDAVGMRVPAPDDPQERRALFEQLLLAQRLLDAAVSLSFGAVQRVPDDLPDAVRSLALTVNDPQLAGFLRMPDPGPGADRRLRRVYALTEDTRAAAQQRSGKAAGPSVVPLRESKRDRLHGLGPVRAVEIRTATRLGIVVAFAELLGLLGPFDHGYWVAITALLVLRTDAAATHVRAAQRALGTMVGVAVAGGLLLARPTEQIAAIGMCVVAYLTPLALARSYLWLTAARTSFALLLIEAPNPAAFSASVMLERIADTLVGTGLAVVAVLLLWPFAATRRLPDTVAVCLRSIAGVLRDGVAGREPTQQQRRAIILQLLSLRSLYEQAVGERSRPWPSTDAFWPVVVFTLRLGAPARSAAEAVETDETQPLLTAAGAGEVASVLLDAADAVQAGEPPAALPWPAGRAAPGLHELAEELNRAVAGAARREAPTVV